MGAALEGVRVLDFTWVVAGPVATRILCDHGAEVIKVERRDSLDFGSRRGGLTGNLNRGKRSIVVNMSDPRGVDLVRRLVPLSDVVIDNFSPRVMGNWGLDYEGLRRLRPDIIAISMSGFGQTGPHRDHVSYGPTLQALSGVTDLMRHPGHEPAGWGFSYADMAGGYSAALAVLIALYYRQRTGRGQLVDLAQYENLCTLLGPPLLELLTHGRVPSPVGNRSQEAPAAPHGVYPCQSRRGQDPVDRWCAIVVRSQAEWEALCRAMGEPEWTRDPRFLTPVGRVSHQDALDTLVGDWTSGWSADEVVACLSAAGVPAAIVADAHDLCERDPQLRARGYWVRVRTPEGEEVTVDGTPVRLSGTPASVRVPGPLLGEHTDDVLMRLLGLSAAESAALRRDGVVGAPADRA